MDEAPRQRRVPQHRVAETVAARLRERILRGDEGRLPPQDQLVQQFGVSYPSVREALRILETEGLVTVRRGSVGGAEVHRPDSSTAAYHFGLALQSERVSVEDLANGLRILEPLCAAECARRRDRLRAVVPVLEANLETAATLLDDGVEFTRTAREFHDLVVAGTANATVRHVVGSLVALWSAQEQAWAETATERHRYPSKAEMRAAWRAHRRLTDAIAEGDATAAERSARSHLIGTQMVLLGQPEGGLVAAAPARNTSPRRATTPSRL